MKVFASHNPDAAIRSRSSSGGIFSMLASETLKAGGTVYGARFARDYSVSMARIDNLQQLDCLRGSKYVFASIRPVLAEIEQDVSDGKQVLVCCTPCQIAALRSRFGSPENLLLVEVVCHGAPRPEIWNKYLDEFCKRHGKTKADIAEINFRDKRNGWKTYSLTIIFKSGKRFTERFEDDLYMRSFLFGYTVREACFNCRFKYPDGSKADITLGDFWGIDKLAPEIDNNSGTTLVIAGTDKGMRAVDSLRVDAVTKLDMAAKYNRAIKSPSRKPAQFDNFLSSVNSGECLLATMKQFAGRPFRKKLKARLKRFLQNLKFPQKKTC